MERLELQKDLVAAFRWTARLNMNEAVSNHFSVCLPNSNDSFYVNRAGIHFSRAKVSDLVLVERSNLEKIKKDPSLVDPTERQLIYMVKSIKEYHKQNVYFMFIQNMLPFYRRSKIQSYLL